MKKNRLLVAIGLCLIFSSNLPSSAGFRENHPKLVKWLGIGAVGAATGGVGGVLMGTGVVHGAAVGVGTHSAFHVAHEKWNERKARRMEARRRAAGYS